MITSISLQMTSYKFANWSCADRLVSGFGHLFHVVSKDDGQRTGQ